MACPTCVAEAPVEVAWSLFEPLRLVDWMDAKLLRVTPEGPLAVGQRIELSTGPLHRFTVTLDVLEVDALAHRLHLWCRLPLGIINDEIMTMMPLGADRCRINFG
jgi:hypothetical protein